MLLAFIQMAWFANSHKEWSGGLPLMPAAPPGDPRVLLGGGAGVLIWTCLTSPHPAPTWVHSRPCSGIHPGSWQQSDLLILPWYHFLLWWLLHPWQWAGESSSVLPFSCPGSFSPGSSGAAGGQPPPQPLHESILHQGVLSKNVAPRPQTLRLTWTSALSPSSWEIVGLSPLKISSAQVTSFGVYIFRKSHFSLHHDSALSCSAFPLVFHKAPSQPGRVLWINVVYSSVLFLSVFLAGCQTLRNLFLAPLVDFSKPCGHQGNTAEEKKTSLKKQPRCRRHQFLVRGMEGLFCFY